MNEQLLREWIRRCLLSESDLLTEAALDSGQVLGFIAEWSVYQAVSGMDLEDAWKLMAGGRVESGTTGQDDHKQALEADGRIIEPLNKAKQKDEDQAADKDKASGNSEATDELRAYMDAHGGRTPSQQPAYLAYEEMAEIFLPYAQSRGNFGGPESGTTPANQPSTAAIDVPCVKADLHVKYNDKSRLESFRRKYINKTEGIIEPGAKSTEIYDDVIRSILQPPKLGVGKNIAMDLPEYQWLTSELGIPAGQIFTKEKFWDSDASPPRTRTAYTSDGSKSNPWTGTADGKKWVLSPFLKAPSELSGTKSLRDRRTALIKESLSKGKQGPRWDREKPTVPLGLIPKSDTGSRAIKRMRDFITQNLAKNKDGYGGLRGDVPTLADQTGNRGGMTYTGSPLWWNDPRVVSSPMSRADLETLARYDDVFAAFKAFTTARSALMKTDTTPEGNPGADARTSRTDLYALLDKAGYSEQLKKDLFQQHFRGVAEAVKTDPEASAATVSTETKPAWYVKFIGKSTGSRKVKALRYPKIPKQSDLEIVRLPDNSVNLYVVKAPLSPTEEDKNPGLGEMLKLQYDWSGQNKPPTLNAGKDYDRFVEMMWMPIFYKNWQAAGAAQGSSGILSPTASQLKPKQLEALMSYVREMLELLRS